MNNLNQHVRSDKVKWIITGIALVLILAILGGVLTAVLTETNPKDWFEQLAGEETETPDEETSVSPIEATISDNEHIRLAMSAAVTAADSEYVEQVLTATVSPSTAEEKGVDWKAEWADGSDSSDLSTYLTVTPESDGSNVCYVRAFAAFDKDIIITVTTRDGGFTATCTVKFVGNPTEMNIDFSELTATYDDGWGVQIYQVKTSGACTLGVTFDNIFGQVNPDFVPNLEYDIEGIGTFVLTESHNDTSSEDLTVNLCSEISYYNSSMGRDMTFSVGSELMGVSVGDDEVTLSPYGVVSSFTKKQYTNSNRTDFYRWTFSHYTDNSKLPYLQITVRETNTGVSETFNVRVVSGVTSVALDNALIVF